MKIQAIKSVYCGFSMVIMITACGPEGHNDSAPQHLALGQHIQQVLAEVPVGSFQEGETSSVCPLPDLAPSKVISIEEDQSDPLIDHDQDLKNLGTNLVVKGFFTSEEALFNFMNLVYGNIARALASYRRDLGVDDKAIFFLFKGGNVLRMVANGVFDLLSPDARDYLKKEYSDDFKRSDADFSVYIDELKLNGVDYDRVLAEVDEIIFRELNKIRDEFQTHPMRYFDFFKLKPDLAAQELGTYFDELGKLNAVADPNNPNWYQAKFNQLQILDGRAKPEPKCNFSGQYDYRNILVDSKMVRMKVTAKPSWVANSDNRTIEFNWGSDAHKTVKFFLLRSKAAFEVFYEKDGDIKRKPLMGELIDVSVPHRKDDRLRAFLDSFDKNVATYTLKSADNKKLSFKSYSLLGLAEDLQFIIFDAFLRPWKGGPKYGKRINRLFFLNIVEMIEQFGVGSSRINQYIDDVQEKIIRPLENLYPLSESSSQTVAQITADVVLISQTWKELGVANEFWQALAKFVDSRLINAPLEGDQSGFADFIATINKKLENAKHLQNMTPLKINVQEVYQVEMKNLL
jgi:hypothetical protein